MAQFIVIEWVDGSGKGTQVSLLKKQLESLWKTVALLDYPRYEEESSCLVRKYLNGEYGTLAEIGPKLASIFYAVDRYDSKKWIEALLASNDFVIANRYVSSNFIHQSAKLETAEIPSFITWAYDLEFNICQLPPPDKIIFLNIRPETSYKLVSAKEQRNYIQWGGNKDLHEKDENHIRKAALAGLTVAKMFPNWTVLECEENGEILPKETITQMILAQFLTA